ncbi:kinase-like domain-containing protein [Glomus cerebriforme]|uniref:Kinase-like domain-containing protein n=1 Tax=Glomus cerebriforme TaxID=658196 RepID=A0A397TJX4_9GLOM|nr:kinase-like domain-containing protein [Glomus cerebriforme]
MSSHNQCKKCDEPYLDGYNANYDWCKQCQINNLKIISQLNWNENEIINNFIQEMQLKICDYFDIIFEWISYHQFIDIKEISNDDFIIKYSATWENGPLDYDDNRNEYIRNQYKKVALKCLYNSRNNINEFLNEVKTYSIRRQDDIPKIYGISQNPDTKDYIMVLKDGYCEKCGTLLINLLNNNCRLCQINYIENNFLNRSENKIIDDFVHEMQLKIVYSDDAVFEWIPIDQFIDFKEIIKIDSNTIYTATWKDGPLCYNGNQKEWERDPDYKVCLKYLYNSQDITIDEFLNNEVKQYSLSKINKMNGILGISQDQYTKDYIIVSPNMYCEKCDKKFTNMFDDFCTSCQINYLEKNFKNWTSGNEEIDHFIQEIQLKINDPYDVVIEWISYDQFVEIKENVNMIYSAIWWEGPLKYDVYKKEWLREFNQEVDLKISQNITVNEFLNEVKEYLTNKIKVYGISQNPDTKNYVIIFQHYEDCEECNDKYIDDFYKWCKSCKINDLKNNFLSWSGDERIDNFIQEIQSKINTPNDIVFEWIPYDQFDNLKVIGQGGFAIVYSAIWKDGPIKCDFVTDKGWTWIRNSGEKVALKCLYNSQNISDEFLKEAKAYSNTLHNNILKIYGMSQNPVTKDYIMVLEFAKGGSFNDWKNKNYNDYNWKTKILTLMDISNGLLKIHQNKMVHRDFHTGNILFSNPIYIYDEIQIYISDMGLCGEANNTIETNIYGVMPYVAPEVLRGQPYTQAADIYSFGMIMYFVATGKQPFANTVHDQYLLLDICKENKRPEINEQEIPKCYIDLMKRCWDSNSDNRPTIFEIFDLIYCEI